MIKLFIPFTSRDGLSTEDLVYELHDHAVALQWKEVVLKSQNLMRATFKNNSQLYGKYFYKPEDLTREIHRTVKLLKNEFPEFWSDSMFDPIRDDNFPMTQINLNLAHSFFEKAHAAISLDRKKMDLYFQELSELNHNIHKYEYILDDREGFYVSGLLKDGLKSVIHDDWNHLFTLDMNWGEMYLSYCHVGEGLYESFAHDYPLKPTPQVDIAGDFLLNFSPDQKSMHSKEFQIWLNLHYGKEVNISDLPVGLVPLAKISGNPTKEELLEFFRKYPLIGNKIRFA